MDLTLHVEGSFIYRWLCKWLNKWHNPKPNYEIINCPKKDCDQFLTTQNNHIQALQNILLLQKIKKYFFELRSDDNLNDDTDSSVRKAVTALVCTYNSTTKMTTPLGIYVGNLGIYIGLQHFHIAYKGSV